MRSVIEASRIAREIGFSANQAQSISTAASELVRNILKYASKGQLSIREIRDAGGRRGIEIEASDRGPGISDIAAAMTDHFSSGGTLGLGLPGVKRMMDDLEIDTRPGEGTRVVIRKYRTQPRTSSPNPLTMEATRKSLALRRKSELIATSPSSDAEAGTPAIDYASVIRPCQGERVSGDAAVVERSDVLTFAAIIDALGHGPLAHRVSLQATRYLKSKWSADLVDTMNRLHEALKGSEGAAVGLCLVDGESRTGRYVGIGNTVLRIIGTREIRLYSSPGTLGHQMRSPREQNFSLEANDVVVLYTDGIKERFDVKGYPQLRFQKPELVARTIVERFGKHHDDAGCVVLRAAR